MLANGPPLALDGSAGLEGSLVDPPISPGPGPLPGEVERGQRCRELHDVPRVSLPPPLTGDRQRWVEERGERREGGTQGEDGEDNR